MVPASFGRPHERKWQVTWRSRAASLPFATVEWFLALAVDIKKHIKIMRLSYPSGLSLLIGAVFSICAGLTAWAQEIPGADPDSSAPDPIAVESKAAPQEPPGGPRVFGVLPNYRTANASDAYSALTARQKFTIATKDSFDYSLVFLAGGFAGLGQLTGQYPSLGQGVKGYAHRLATSYADQAVGSLMTEGLFPGLLHGDPRYFRRAEGSARSRTLYALSRIFVTRTDSGGTRFNYSEWVGNAAGVALSNAYYPDGRTAGANVAKLVEQCGTDAISQVLKEFWPDIRRKLFKPRQS